MIPQAFRYNASIIRYHDQPVPSASGDTALTLVDRHGNAIGSKIERIDGMRLTNWQGTVALSPLPRTNIILWSEDFTQSVWNKNNAAISSPGVNSADGIPFNEITATSSSNPGINNNAGIAGSTTGTTFARRVVLRAGTSDQCLVQNYFNGGGGGTSAVSTVVSGPGTVIDAVNGIFGSLSTTEDTVVEVVSDCPADGATPTFYIKPYPFASGNSVLATAVQMEQAASVGNYIPTTTAPVTVTDYIDNGDGTLALGQAAGSGDAYDFSGVQRR